MFKRTTTNRSMTVKLKTVKTSDLDMTSNASVEFLGQFNNDDDNDIEDGRTKITIQQKTKYIMHWLFLIGSHFYCFWYIPVNGNYQLYGFAHCDEDQKEVYRCYNFKDNTYLRYLYLLMVAYLIVSSFQIAYGFPIKKKPSSVLQYYNDLGNLSAQIYMQLPFIVEIRCLLDWVFSKTALDIFQFWQLWNYHCELFLSWTGNKYYTEKTLGSPAECLDKCIFGVLIASVILFLLIGPFILFSTSSPYVGFNPISQAYINFNF